MSRSNLRVPIIYFIGEFFFMSSIIYQANKINFQLEWTIYFISQGESKGTNLEDTHIRVLVKITLQFNSYLLLAAFTVCSHSLQYLLEMQQYFLSCEGFTYHIFNIDFQGEAILHLLFYHNVELCIPNGLSLEQHCDFHPLRLHSASFVTIRCTNIFMSVTVLVWAGNKNKCNKRGNFHSRASHRLGIMWKCTKTEILKHKKLCCWVLYFNKWPRHIFLFKIMFLNRTPLVPSPLLC